MRLFLSSSLLFLLPILAIAQELLKSILTHENVKLNPFIKKKPRKVDDFLISFRTFLLLKLLENKVKVCLYEALFLIPGYSSGLLP